ncbi:MAG: flagellar basal body-associated FliL family protein [Spongiibacteraceae bacterium]|jgi:flagellar FliL protein|nr:flagellar basal body-associated FliL family protein [Spongiibacteraceae bacterium]
MKSAFTRCGHAAALTLLATVSGLATAASQSQEGTQYVELQPAFVTNYGGPGPIHFLKADLAVRVAGAAAAGLVEHHMPQLRHELVMLLSNQTEASLSSVDDRERLRQQALTAVQAVLERETGAPVAEDLLFNSFVLQR